MFRKLMKNKKAQNTAEYAILISLVVAGIIAMQTYAQRALQSRVRGAVTYLQNQTGGSNQLGDESQYEPYYLKTDYTVTRDETDSKVLSNRLVRQDVQTNRRRAVGGTQESLYNADAYTELGNGV